MSQKNIRIVIGTLSLVLILLYNNCTQSILTRSQGTEVGNPVTGNEILSAVCGVINRCKSDVSLSQCRTGVLSMKNFDYQLSLPSGAYANFAEVISAEESGAISPNPAASVACSTAIAARECSDPLVQSAYDPTMSNPFSGVVGLIPMGAGS